MKSPPPFLKRYFWDVDFETLDIKEHAANIIGRLLESGDEKAVSWMMKNYPKEEISDVLFQFRFVSPKSANYWVLVLNLPRERVLCLKKHYLETQRKHWPY